MIGEKTKGGIIGGGIAAAVLTAASFTGALDKLGLASDEELKQLPSKAEISALQEDIHDLKAALGTTDGKLDGVQLDLASFRGAWIQWKENQEGGP